MRDNAVAATLPRLDAESAEKIVDVIGLLSRGKDDAAVDVALRMSGPEIECRRVRGLTVGFLDTNDLSGEAALDVGVLDRQEVGSTDVHTCRPWRVEQRVSLIQAGERRHAFLDAADHHKFVVRRGRRGLSRLA
jgi:hypothetical protein